MTAKFLPQTSSWSSAFENPKPLAGRPTNGALSQLSRSSCSIALLLTTKETTGMMQRAARLVIRFPSRPSSSSASPSPHCVVLDKYDAMRRSNIRWRGRSFVAALPSESEKPLKGRRRIGKVERRVLMESFVQNYRDANEGKFPTVSLIQKQLGGSYYVVREILQRLIYESKFPSLDTREKTNFAKPKEHTENELNLKKRHSSDEREGISNSSATQICTSSEQSTNFVVHSPTVESLELDESQSLKVVETNKELSTLDNEKFLNSIHDFNSQSVSDSNSEVNLVEVRASSRTSEVEDALDEHLDPVTVNKPNDIAQTDPIADSSQNHSGEHGSSGHTTDGLNDQKKYGSDKVQEYANQEDPKTKDLNRGMHVQLESPKISKRSTVWNNLKSIADGLINFWKRV